MNVANLMNGANLKHGLCTVVIVAILSYVLPSVMPSNDDPENMLNKVNNVFKSVQENPLPVLIVVFVACLLGGVLCGSDMGASQ